MVFTEKPYTEPLKCNNNIEPCDVNDAKISHGSLQSVSDVPQLAGKTTSKCFTVSILAFIHSFRQGFWLKHVNISNNKK